MMRDGVKGMPEIQRENTYGPLRQLGMRNDVSQYQYCLKDRLPDTLQYWLDISCSSSTGYRRRAIILASIL